LSAFLNSLKKGKPFSPSLLMKRPRATIIPFFTKLHDVFLVGWLGHLADSVDLRRVGLMPRCPTMKPRSNLEGTPKTHFVGLSFHWNSRRLAKVSVKSVMSLSSSVVLTTTSST
jgi:hypothetical protein